MQPVSFFSLALLLSTLSLAAPTPYSQDTTSELVSRRTDSELNTRDLPQDEDGYATLTSRAAWTRSQEAALQRARAEYARLNALRGQPGFNQQAWLHAQQEYNRLQAAKTANGSRVNMRSVDVNDEEDTVLTLRAAWTRSQEAALQRARAEYGRLNALRGQPGFDQAAWLRAQQEYNRLQAAKTANGSRVNTRSIDFDDDGESTLIRRTAWTRQKEAALQAARAEYERQNALRGHQGFDEAAWRRAQQAYNQLQREKTDNGSTVNQNRGHHGRGMENLEEMD